MKMNSRREELQLRMNSLQQKVDEFQNMIRILGIIIEREQPLTPIQREVLCAIGRDPYGSSLGTIKKKTLEDLLRLGYVDKYAHISGGNTHHMFKMSVLGRKKYEEKEDGSSQEENGGEGTNLSLGS